MLYKFQITLSGRIQAVSRSEAEGRIRDGLCLSLPLHEAIDDLVIHTIPVESIEDLQTRFK